MNGMFGIENISPFQGCLGWNVQPENTGLYPVLLHSGALPLF